MKKILILTALLALAVPTTAFLFDVFGAVESTTDAAPGKSPAFTPSGIERAGGPDGFGYTFQDSDESGGPSFYWHDISATGTQVTLSDDSFAGPFNIGFNFNFYGVNQTQIYISSNGHLTFGAGSSNLSNVAIPTATAPNNMIAVYWDDLNPASVPSRVLYQQVSADTFIVQYNGVPRYSATGYIYAQAVLLSNGNIDLIYRDFSSDWPFSSGGTAGIEDAAGTVGLQVSYNETPPTYWHDSLRVRILYPQFFSGALQGTVTANTGGAPIAGVVVTAHSDLGDVLDTTDGSGNYSMLIDMLAPPETLYVDFVKTGWNPLTAQAVITDGGTTILNVQMTAPQIQLSTTGYHVTVPPGGMHDELLTITNNGDGELTWNVSYTFPSPPPPPLPKPPGHMENFSDLVYGPIDLEAAGSGNGNLGVCYDWVNGHFYVSDRNAGGGDIHQIREFSAAGTLLNSYVQGTVSVWGWRDLCFDGTYIYGSDENELCRWDPVSASRVGTLPRPAGISPCRALAVDGRDSGHLLFYAANWNSNIVEFDTTGATLRSVGNALQLYGLAFDPISPGGPFLWGFSQDGVPAITITQISVATLQPTGISFMGTDPAGTDDIAGGCDIAPGLVPGLNVLLTINQGTPVDLALGYELSPYTTWLSSVPSSGTVPASGSFNDTIRFDASSYSSDTTLYGTVVFMNNTGTPASVVCTMDVAVGVPDENPGIPTAFALHAAYPNPFNPATTIAFDLPAASHVRLDIYNVLGQQVATLVEGNMPAGSHSIRWDAGKFTSGIYMARIRTDNNTAVRKLVLLR